MAVTDQIQEILAALEAMEGLPEKARLSRLVEVRNALLDLKWELCGRRAELDHQLEAVTRLERSASRILAAQ